MQITRSGSSHGLPEAGTRVDCLRQKRCAANSRASKGPGARTRTGERTVLKYQSAEGIAVGVSFQVWRCSFIAVGLPYCNKPFTVEEEGTLSRAMRPEWTRLGDECGSGAAPRHSPASACTVRAVGAW